MKAYLANLGVLLGRVVLPEELCSLEQTEALRQASQKFRDQPVTSCEIDATETQTNRFKGFIERLHTAHPSPLSVWMTHVTDCGTLVVPSLQDMKFDFSFFVKEGGVLTFATSDVCDRLVLDFFDSATGTQRLTIETQGKHWSDVRY